MNYFPIAAAILTAIVLALLLPLGTSGLVAFLAAGALGGYLAGRMPKGSELVYWVFVGVTVVLFLASLLGLDSGRLLMMLPLVVAVSYFIARLVGRFTGTRDKLPG